ncbi:MAG: sensor histidine kinase [Clostridiaceae bacterium]|nr:sensor histidine kinase [Clostridiaceae bacterium]
MIKRIRNLIANSTIKQKLSALIIVFVLYPIVIVTFFGYFTYARDIRSGIIRTLTQNIERVNELTSERFGQTRQFAMMIPYDGTLNELFIDKKNGKISESDLYKDLTNYLYSKFYSKQEISAVSFFFTENPYLVYMVHSDNSYHRYMNDIHPVVTKVAEELKEQFGYYVSDDGELYVIRKMVDRFSFKQYGTFVIKIDKEYMLKYFREEFPPESGIILTYEGRPIFENGYIPEEDKSTVIEKINSDYSPDMNTGMGSLKPYEVLPSSIKLDNITLKYGVVMPYNLMMDRYYSALRLLVILTCLVAVSLITIAIPMSRAIWSPIEELVGLMKKLEEGNLGIQSQREKNDEFKFIFDSFNNMSNEIKYLFDVAYKEEIARKEAQLAALQARINPHFLYNTLEIMNWKARLAGNNELSEMIEALGTLLDAGMNRGGERTGLLKDELNLIDSYMFIINKRFGKRLKFIKSVDDSLLNAAMPRLLIQPLLENAVVHGMEPVGGGEIHLTIKRVDEHLEITVEDDGAGIPEKDLQEFRRFFSGEPANISNSTGIGIKNVHNRIQILYGKDYGISLEKGKERGTVATITIPYIV